MGKSIAEISAEALKLESYFKDKKPGEKFTYSQIETDTGIKMNMRGKQFIATAMRRLNREYATIKGIGIELASASNSPNFADHRVGKVKNAVKRTKKTMGILIHDFISEWNEPTKKRMLFLDAVAGSIEIAANQARIGNELKMVQGPSIPLPKIK